MEHGVSESVKEQEVETTIKTEVEPVATPADNIDIEVDLHLFKPEPELVQSVKSGPAWLLDEKILEDSNQDGNELPCVQRAIIPAGTNSLNEACGTSLGDSFNVKHEVEDMYIGPTILQQMDIYYTVNKNVSVATEENFIISDCNQAMASSKVKTEITEDKLGANNTVSQQQISTITSSVITYPSNESRYETAKIKLKTDVCDKEYSLKTAKLGQSGDLSKQMKVYTVKKPFQCNTCDARFTQNCYLIIHMRNHTAEKPHRCDNARFGQSTSLTQHMRIRTVNSNENLHGYRRNTDERPYRCDLCDARFTRSVGLRNHMRIHTNEKSSSIVSVPANRSQNEKAKTKLKTNVCDKEHSSNAAKFAQSSDLTKQARVQKAKELYQCKTCDASFIRRGGHMRINTGEKPYQCDTCDATFSNKSNLYSHIGLHGSAKPFRCDTCDAKFRQYVGLSWRTKINSGKTSYNYPRDTGEKPFQCDTCDSRFALNKGLKQHMRIHTGEKPFRCDTCDARFGYISTLKRHKKCHTG